MFRLKKELIAIDLMSEMGVNKIPVGMLIYNRSTGTIYQKVNNDNLTDISTFSEAKENNSLIVTNSEFFLGLDGGTITGDLEIAEETPTIILTDTTSPVGVHTGNISMKDVNGTIVGGMGFFEAQANKLNIFNKFDLVNGVRINDNIVWHAGNDGHGTGLDADVLDGMQPSNENTASTVVNRDASGNFSANVITADLVGNASTATTLETPRTISISGDAFGNVIFDGSQDSDIVLTVHDNSHNHLSENISDATDSNIPNMVIKRSSDGSFSAQNINAEGNLTVTGNLTVNGTTTTVNSTTVTVDDVVLTLGGDTPPSLSDGKDRGIEFRWHDGNTDKIGFFGFDASTGKLTFIPDATNASEVFSGTIGELDATIDWNKILNKPDPQITVTLSGDIVGSSTTTLTDLTNGDISIVTTIQNDSVELGIDTIGNYVSTLDVSGNGLSITASGEAVNQIITSNATELNTPSTIVFRDINGDFHTNKITTNYLNVNNDLNVLGNTVLGDQPASDTIILRGITTAENYIKRTTPNGTAAWMQQDGTGRQHWYWNTLGGNNPTFINGNESATSISMTGGLSPWFRFRVANGTGKLANDPLVWTTLFHIDETNITYNNNEIWHSGNDGHGSGLDADVLDGMQPSSTNIPNSIISRDSNGNFSANEISASVFVGDGSQLTNIPSTNFSKIVTEQIINSGTFYEIDTWTIFGIDTDARERFIKVLVLDSDTLSPTYNMWINSEAVATSAVKDNRYIRIYNDYSASLSFHITIK